MLNYVIILNKSFPFVEPSPVDHIKFIVKYVPLCFIEEKKILCNLDSLIDFEIESPINTLLLILLLMCSWVVLKNILGGLFK